jgi:hypothetical protein
MKTTLNPLSGCATPIAAAMASIAFLFWLSYQVAKIATQHPVTLFTPLFTPEKPAERMKETWHGRGGAFILHDDQTGADYLLNGSGGILKLDAQ